MTISPSWKRIYDGAAFCDSCDSCPAVEADTSVGLVRISDPAKPERGSVTMTVEEYNTLLTNARKIA